LAGQRRVFEDAVNTPYTGGSEDGAHLVDLVGNVDTRFVGEQQFYRFNIACLDGFVQRC